MKLFDKFKQDELNQVIYDLLFKKHQISRNDIAHFCEHDGICICFTQASTTWHALAPCALKPWWLFLNPLRSNTKKLENRQDNNKNKITKNNEIKVKEKDKQQI